MSARDAILNDPILAQHPRLAERWARELEIDERERESRPIVPLGPALLKVQHDARDALTADPLPASLEGFKCPGCRDTGFVRYDVAFNHPDFGRAHPCEKCNREAVASFHRARLRKAYPARYDLLEQAKKVLTTDYLKWVPLTEKFTEDDALKAKDRIIHARGAARRFADTWPAGILALSGPCGIGKSCLIAKCYAVAWRAGLSAHYVTGGDLIVAAYDFERLNALRSDLSAFDVLAIDEADHVTRDTKHRAEALLFDIVDARRRAGKSTILAGNNLEERLEEAIRSRAGAGGSCWVDMRGVPDARPYHEGRDDWQGGRG